MADGYLFEGPMTMKFNYGGQALIEGVMIRGRKGVSVAVRDPQGHIVTHTERLEGGLYRTPVGQLPFIRGVLALWETLTVGTRMLMFSANVAAGHAPAGDQEPPGAVTGTVAAALSVAVGIFFVLPLLLLHRTNRRLRSPLASNLLEGALRLGMFVGYIQLIARLEGVQRVFAYHGAEHKAVHAYEHEAPLEPEDVQRFPTAHPRCGTAFLLQVMARSAVVFSLFGRPSLARRLALRVVMVPLLSSVSYELLRLGARNANVPLTRLLARPGLLLQRLTTREPDDAQVEAAIADTELMLADGLDEEMQELARDELRALRQREAQINERLKLSLIPEDPNDEKDVIVEIRAGPGGDEAGLFAAALFRMYSRYAERRRWPIEMLNSNENAAGGLKEVIFEIHGRGAYSRMKFESGVHRVQRVPETEAQGRIHTSTATVVVLPEVEEVAVNIDEDDLRIDVFRSQGHGGQSVNTTDSAVRITHKPT